MQKILASIALAALLATALPAVSADTATGSLNYILALGARLNHGVPDVPTGLGVNSCSTFLINNFGGCLGGGQVRPSNFDPTNPVRFLKMTLTIVDDVSGANVFASVCNFNPAGDSTCQTGANTLDGLQDARASGCGVTLTADATGIHIGNVQASAFAYLFETDVTTTEVCVGTRGSLNVVFDTV